MDYLENTNNQYTQEPYNYDKFLNSSNKLYLGKVVKANRNNHLFLTYIVNLIDHGFTEVECQLATLGSSYNGIGKTVPLEVDTPVLVLFKEGHLQYGFIIGTFNTWGEYDEIYNEGKLQTANSTDDYNQPLNIPNRITQPDSIVEAYPDKREYRHDGDNQVFIENLEPEERYNKRPLPGVIKLHNTNGDLVTYTPNQNIQYSEGNIIQVAGGTKTDKLTNLSNFAQAHYQTALSSFEIKKDNTEVDFKDLDNFEGIKAKTKSQVDDYLNTATGNINNRYVFEEELKLANAYNSLIREENALIHALQDEVDTVFKNNEAEGEGKIVNNNYTPEVYESKLPAGKTEIIDRKFKYVVLHNAGRELDRVEADIQDIGNTKSYHLVLDKNNKVFEYATFDKSVNSIGELVYKSDNNLDRLAFAVGIITDINDRVNEEQYLSIAYYISKLKKENKLETDFEILTHQELQELNFEAISDILVFNKDRLLKLLNGFS